MNKQEDRRETNDDPAHTKSPGFNQAVCGPYSGWQLWLRASLFPAMRTPVHNTAERVAIYGTPQPSHTALPYNSKPCAITVPMAARSREKNTHTHAARFHLRPPKKRRGLLRVFQDI